jgi:hypothetical protein
MALSKFSRKLLSSERISFKLKNRRKRKWVHEFSKHSLTFGEFYHLYREPRFHPDKFTDYLRMSKETSDTQGFFGFHISSLLNNLFLHLKQNRRRTSEV